MNTEYKNNWNFVFVKGKLDLYLKGKKKFRCKFWRIGVPT